MEYNKLRACGYDGVESMGQIAQMTGWNGMLETNEVYEQSQFEHGSC